MQKIWILAWSVKRQNIAGLCQQTFNFCPADNFSLSCFAWRKKSNYFKIALWWSDFMKRNFGGFTFQWKSNLSRSKQTINIIGKYSGFVDSWFVKTCDEIVIGSSWFCKGLWLQGYSRNVRGSCGISLPSINFAVTKVFHQFCGSQKKTLWTSHLTPSPFKVEKILKGSLDSIPSPTPSNYGQESLLREV